MKEIFQLHHTGIKTVRNQVYTNDNKNFNCTIQELKLFYLFSVIFCKEFQLHHTGIKTH